MQSAEERFRQQIEQLNTAERLQVFGYLLLKRFFNKTGLFVMALCGVALACLALTLTANPVYVIAGILFLILARLAI